MADPKTKTPDSIVGLLKWNPATNKWLFWDGAITVSGSVDTELPAAVALADDVANPTVPAVGSYLMGYNRTNNDWDRVVVSRTNADGLASHSAGNLVVQARPIAFNGASWDRVRGNKEAGLHVTGAPLALRADDGATYLYVGKAVAGSLTSSAVWQIQRITQADLTLVWADGNGSFDNVWDNYASLSYS